MMTTTTRRRGDFLDFISTSFPLPKQCSRIVDGRIRSMTFVGDAYGRGGGIEKRQRKPRGTVRVNYRLTNSVKKNVAGTRASAVIKIAIVCLFMCVCVDMETIQFPRG